MKTPLILDIKGNSLDDGPGIRTVVFFKGCPLSCLWCHNPESKQAHPEIAFDPAVCIGCNTCLSNCPRKALSRVHPFFIDRTRCDLCFNCTDTCPSGALSRVGKSMDVDAIMQVVLKDKPFFDTSGGGITLSGGEPTLFPEFAAELLAAGKAAGIHTLIETSGFFDLRTFESALLCHVDMIFYDLKLIDPYAHMRFCGVSNERILTNFQALNSCCREKGIPLLPRTPLIPGITDTAENLRGIALFLRNCGVKNIQLLPYHPLWREKNIKIGIPEVKSMEGDMQRFLSADKIKAGREIFETEQIVVMA